MWVDNTPLDDNPEESEECTCNELDRRDENSINPGGGETLLDSENEYTLVMAPGEGKKALSIIYDENMDELGFTKVQCGQKRIFEVRLSHLDIIKSEVSREDRRAVRPDYLFTALKKQQVIILKNNISICFRKKMLKGAPILAGNILDAGFISNLIQHDDGYRVLTETRWPELLKTLKLVVDKEDITEEEAEKLPYLGKARLIQSDPFICGTYFEITFQELRKT
ncbi:unnamed protein product [Hermetia illucens]|uniref:Uncharacterized protein n=1 Tax=Hermetia illucens TaxID=343691 RepID=A0A7R8UCT1_HERIL|nr:unnamed protein product [Hermetia illucens]